MFDAENFLKHVTQQPGVYRMFAADGQLVYVGKARNLKKRLTSYFRSNLPDQKTAQLVSQIADIKLMITHSEDEALLLESNFIKKYKPRYNILLRDSKGYPYVYLSSKHEFPRIDFYRGNKKLPGDYFGPYPNKRAVRETLKIMQKLFRLRNCKDSFFQNRTRPCLQYQIKRCTAPCVDYISADDYANSVRDAVMFLEGKSKSLIERFVQQMEQASQTQAYEKAAQCRDIINNLRQIQQQQHVANLTDDTDVIVILRQHGIVALHLLHIRAEQLIGDSKHYPQVPLDLSDSAILSQFISIYYTTMTPTMNMPKKIVCSLKPDDQDWLASSLQTHYNKKINLFKAKTKQQQQWVDMALASGQQALQQKILSRKQTNQRLLALQQALALPTLPRRLECFDISHSLGEATIASCVVFGETGPIKQDYRRFRITGLASGGDDYAAIKQAVSRRFKGTQRDEDSVVKLPDVLFIDGGKGQLQQAITALAELDLDHLLVIAVAKGAGRKAGLETLYRRDQMQGFYLAPDDIALHLIQHIRDESHRFALAGHRHARQKNRTQSVLQDIEGIGAKRRKQLLQAFGGIQGLQQASCADIANVKGISQALAARIYAHFHAP